MNAHVIYGHLGNSIARARAASLAALASHRASCCWSCVLCFGSPLALSVALADAWSGFSSVASRRSSLGLMLIACSKSSGNHGWERSQPSLGFRIDLKPSNFIRKPCFFIKKALRGFLK